MTRVLIPVWSAEGVQKLKIAAERMYPLFLYPLLHRHGADYEPFARA